MSSKWIPDQKVIAGGVATTLAWFVLMFVADRTGVSLGGVEGISGIAGALGALVMYFVPASARDVVNKIDADVVAILEHMAQEDEPDPAADGSP